MNRIIFFLTIHFLIVFTAKAQETLSLQDAIKIALENNYDIRLVKNQNEIRENNVNIGEFLPGANASLANNNSITNSRQVLANGTEQTRSGAKNSSLAYGVSLNWTIFDGFGMFTRYEQAKELQKYGEAYLQLTILNTVADVANIYFALVQQQQQLNAYDTAVSISKYRLQIAQSRFEIGKSSRLEVLNAQVDFNTDTTRLLRQRELYANTQTQLNQVLGRDVNTRFRVTENVKIDDKLALEPLLAQAQKQNPALQTAQINRRVAELEMKNVRSGRYPTITLNSGYNFTDNRYALGFATQTTGRGPYYGISANINLFNGFQQYRNEQNASININNAQLQYEQQKLNINAELSRAYQTYLTNLALVQLEQKNQQIAAQNMDITFEKFRIGTIATVELRNAQLNYIDATTRLSNAQYQAKLAETELKQLAGNITF